MLRAAMGARAAAPRGARFIRTPPAAARCEPLRPPCAPPAAVAAPRRAAPPPGSAKRAFSTTAVALVRGGKGEETKTAEVFQQQQYSPPVGQPGGSEYDSLTPEIRKYMSKVYNVVGSGVVTASAGTAAMFFTPLGTMVGPAIGLAAFVPILWLSFKPPATFGGRLALFHASTGFVGAGIAPVVAKAVAGGVLGSALVLTAAVFGGFSAAALLAPRGAALKLMGPLIAGMMGMMVLLLVNMIFPGSVPFMKQIWLFGGLAIFSLMISADTGAMIERARQGAQDPVQDGLSMFLNLVNVFVRLVAMLTGGD